MVRTKKPPLLSVMLLTKKCVIMLTENDGHASGWKKERKKERTTPFLRSCNGGYPRISNFSPQGRHFERMLRDSQWRVFIGSRYFIAGTVCKSSAHYATLKIGVILASHHDVRIQTSWNNISKGPQTEMLHVYAGSEKDLISQKNIYSNDKHSSEQSLSFYVVRSALLLCLSFEFHATCCGDKILSPQQNFSAKTGMSHEENCHCKMSPQHVP